MDIKVNPGSKVYIGSFLGGLSLHLNHLIP